MRETAMREKPVQVGEPDGGVQGDAQLEEPVAAKPGKRVRFTLDLSREQHKFLKTFALEAETDASIVVRTLLTRLEQDEVLAKEVFAELSN
jgi:hypothetical protein